MGQTRQRYGLASDNTAGICPESWAKLAEANAGETSSYGEDQWTEQVCARIGEIFGRECEVFFVFNGTAANALALAQLCDSYQSILCHENAHIECDECGAPEFFTGGSKLVLVQGAQGKLDLASMRAALAKHRELHSHKPGAISLTQSTELGTVYSLEELHRLAVFARDHGLRVHMDGARFANAVAALDCRPAEMIEAAGVDVLCFGGTKNGAGGGELIVFFNTALTRNFDYRLKQGGQLASKMRFLAAPWLGLLESDVWLKNARHANRMARRLADAVCNRGGVRLAFPCQANAVFMHLEERVVRELHRRGWHFYKFLEPDIYRVMCSWSVTEEMVDEFAGELRAVE